MRTPRFDRRSVMKGALKGAAVMVGIPTLDLFLDGNGEALANGRPLPVRFGTYFWGLGLTDTPQGSRWVPTKQGHGYDITPELESIKALKDKVSVFSGFRAIGDGKPNLVHWSGLAAIMSGSAPAASNTMDRASFDTMVAEAIGQSTRFRTLDMSASGKPLSNSTHTGKAFATPEVSPLALYTRLFGEGFQDPNNPNWKPDPRVMLRQSVLSAVKDQRDALAADVGKADRIKLDQYYTSVREMENQLALQLEKPEYNAACVVPPKPGAERRGASIDIVNENSKAMARLLAMALVCNQTRVFNFVHTAGASETYLPGDSKIYHQYSHDEPTDATLGYQVNTSKLAGVVMQAFGDFLTELDAVKEGDRTVLDNSIIMGYSDTGYAKIHSLENIPMFLAGGAGGKHKAGQHIRTTGEPVTRVSLTAMQLAGAPVGEFGAGAMKTSSPLTEVLA
ncbi:DUF1552 domain-containing protein [Sphingomonas sp.]|uniref:DUF1552 domain-containing protein n=1 Tax=Sphingomonas sp. TaxID=28214 RepID=UPI0035C7AECE